LVVKRAVVERALARVDRDDVLSIASELGGFEIVGLAGVILSAARARIPVVLDGFIVGAAALLAQRIAPQAIEYCIAAHRSQEPGHAIALAALGLEPLFDLRLRLGEGSGAALALPLIEAAARMVREMRTFAEAGVAEKEDAR
jgi:nicotinate-nucleotide--dimethylbenzimidazole phosphoribosyltransferase